MTVCWSEGPDGRMLPLVSASLFHERLEAQGDVNQLEWPVGPGI